MDKRRKKELLKQFKNVEKIWDLISRKQLI